MQFVPDCQFIGNRDYPATTVQRQTGSVK